MAEETATGTSLAPPRDPAATVTAVYLIAIALTVATSPSAMAACEVPRPDMVTVIVDMDPSEAGCQSSVRVLPGTTLVKGVAVYILDEQESHSVWGLGYFGGIDRGLAFGHTPGNTHQGTVTALHGTTGTPVNPQNHPSMLGAPAFQPGFEGPEVQYAEFGALGPGVMSADPAGPVFTVDIELENATEGDVFAFHVLDLVSVWSLGTGGVFSTQEHLSLDTGGDAVPDGTVALDGIDPDHPISVPPAAFEVDFVDGQPTGPATIRVSSDVRTGVRSWSTLKARFAADIRPLASSGTGP